MAEQDVESQVVCANRDCLVGKTGKCVEGFETAKCPHFGHASEESGVDPDGSEFSDGVSLPAADTLNIYDTSQVLREGPTRVIAIVGPSDAGKTSLIASLYDLFQENAVCGVDFAGSLSLQGFERACHDARAASRRNVPHINRTPHGEVHFYHLALSGGPAGDGLSLALGDRAGEEYRSAADEVSMVTKFSEVLRADTITILVDGERLSDVGARHNLRSQITMMLQALMDGGAVLGGQRLAVVLTKLDVVKNAPNPVRTEADFVELLSSIRTLFGSNFSTIASFQIAASPKTDLFSRGTGVPQLFSFWLQPREVVPTPIRSPVFSRCFDRLRPLD
jgi:hypothetical protein